MNFFQQTDTIFSLAFIILPDLCRLCVYVLLARELDDAICAEQAKPLQHTNVARIATCPSGITPVKMVKYVSFPCLTTFLLLYTILLVLLLSDYFTWSWRGVLNVTSGSPALQSSGEGQLPFGSNGRRLDQTSTTSALFFKALLPKNASLEVNTGVKTSPREATIKKTTKRKSLRVSLTSERDFQPIHHNSIFVYSAYYNSVRRHPEVTVVAVVNRSAMVMPDARPIGCVYRGVGSASSAVSGELTIFPDHHGQE